MAQAVPEGTLTFRFPYADGSLINDEMYPEGAVGFTPEGFDRIRGVEDSELDQPIHRGFWCGVGGHGWAGHLSPEAGLVTLELLATTSALPTGDVNL